MKTIKKVKLVTFLENGVDGFVMFGTLFNFNNGELTKEYLELLTQEHVSAFKSRPDVFTVEEEEAEEKPVEKVKEVIKVETVEDKVVTDVKLEELKVVVEKPVTEVKQTEVKEEKKVGEKPQPAKKSETKVKN